MLRSIRNRLALLFFVITLAAFAVVYVLVVPSLGSTLRTEKLNTLADAAANDSDAVTATIGSTVSNAGVARAVRRAATLSNARVTLLGVYRSEGVGAPEVQTSVIADSQTSPPSLSVVHLPLAIDAATSGRTLTTVAPGPGGQVAQAARPLLFHGNVDRVIVYSSPLSDVQRSVAVIRNKILIAGAIALALALIAGAVVARLLSQRIKRLERAAWRVAEGDFSAPFEVDSPDELGDLAQALGAMQRQLAELDSARERFIATASHELRTPIFSLGGFLELIQDEELDEDTRRQFLGQVREQVDRLGKLATGLLDLSRLEAGGLELHPEPSDLSAIARTVTSEFVPALAAHSSHLRLRLAHEPLSVVCDPERVAQIMRILIDNAITHTPPGTDVVVAALTVGAPGNGGGARVTVRDFGPGVPEAALPRIFEPFYTSDGVQGSGLGLAIAHELAERMQGRLDVRSRPGRTVFTLDLPG